jgi:hypothetical protein
MRDGVLSSSWRTLLLSASWNAFNLIQTVSQKAFAEPNNEQTRRMESPTELLSPQATP